MTINIKKLESKNLNKLYEFLKKEKFPNLPNKQEAFKELTQLDNHIYLGFYNEEMVLFLCFSERNQKLYFDIACNKKYRRKWATKKTMKFIFNTAFNNLGYDDFIVESLNQHARNVVEGFGFKKEQGFFYSLRKNSKMVERYLKSE